MVGATESHHGGENEVSGTLASAALMYVSFNFGTDPGARLYFNRFIFVSL